MPDRSARTILKPTGGPDPDLAPTRRTRTPPDIKWLLNERAALAGTVAKAADKQRALGAKLERLAAQLEGVMQLIARAQRAQNRAQASIDAIDATMELAHPRVRSASAGEVSAWAGKYGKRGGLGEFIEHALQQAAPAPLTTTVLIDLASVQFGVTFPLPTDRRAFRKSVSSALGSLLKRGLVEPLHSREDGSHGLWRWRAPETVLAGLRARATEMRREVEQAVVLEQRLSAGKAAQAAA